MTTSSPSEPNFLTSIPPLPKTEFCIYGTVHAYPEHADALEAVYAETTRLAQFEPGVIYYCLTRDTQQPHIFYFFEQYTGKQAFEDHNAQPIIQKLMADKFIRGVEAKFGTQIKPSAPIEK
jgi:quinol monooxygenase YgiN